MAHAVWALGLLAICVVWMMATHTAMEGFDGPGVEILGMGIGGGGFIWVTTAVGAAVGYLLTKRRAVALWTWTALIMVMFLVLSIGALQSMRMQASETRSSPLFTRP